MGSLVEESTCELSVVLWQLQNGLFKYLNGSTNATKFLEWDDFTAHGGHLGPFKAESLPLSCPGALGRTRVCV